MKQRNWSTEEKLAIVLEGIKELKSVSEICRTHQISQTTYYKWRDAFLEGAKQALVKGRPSDGVYRAEIEKLEKIIGKQAIVIEVLKKTDELFGRK